MTFKIFLTSLAFEYKILFSLLYVEILPILGADLGAFSLATSSSVKVHEYNNHHNKTVIIQWKTRAYSG